MKLNTRLLVIAAFFVLVLPLVFTGNGAAQHYVGDGAVHDATTTGWKITPLSAGSGCPSSTTKTSKPDCETVRFPSYTSSAACSAGPEFTANQSIWMSACTNAGVAVNLVGGDRNALECDKLGGTYASACVGKWSDPTDLDGGTTYQCLRCHNNTYQRNSYKARWKSSYLKTGHKNMLRKVTAAQPWAGPDGLVYDVHAAGSGTTIDWTNATVTTTSMTPATRALYYIYGDWMAPAPSLVYDNSAAGTGTSAKYTCASCHTTGYVATNFVAGMEPNNTYPALTGGITGSWDVNGIVCSRCHNSVLDAIPSSYVDPYRTSIAWGSNLTMASHHGSSGGTFPQNAAATALCIECHNSTQTKNDPAGQLKTTAAGNGFSGHILGNQFLNSVHGQFTGTSGQVGTDANYASAFAGGTCKIIKTGITSTSGQLVEAMTEDACADLVTDYTATSYVWTPGSQGNCSTCHDVHQSIVPEVGAAEPLRRECTTCHTKPLAVMNHPTGAGTPAALAGSVESVACEVCHMATESVEGSTHLPVHLWRINTSASYSTFPSATEWSAGTKIAYTAPDGAYTNAVWVDLDLACGQCHGGSGTAKAGVPQFSKDLLATYAANIHNSKPTASFNWSTDATTPYKINVTASGCPTGDTCTYDWTWGDTTSSTGVATAATSKTYAATTVRTVTLVINDLTTGGTSAATSRQVGPINVVVTPPAPSKYTVSGKVVRLDGTTAVANASVRLKASGVLKKLTATKADGTYTLTDVVPGTYDVEVVKIGLTYTSQSVTVVAANLTGINFTGNR